MIAEQKKAAAPTKEAAADHNERRNDTKPAAEGKPKFDLDELKTRLPEYLEKCGIPHTRKGEKITAPCPIHRGKKPNFHAENKSGSWVWICRSGCGGDGGSVIDLHARLHGLPAADHGTIAEVAELVGVSAEGGHHFPTAATPRRTRHTPKPKTPPPAPELTDRERTTINAARLAFSDAFWSGDLIVNEIAEALGFTRETLRLASWGSCGLGFSEGWICYAYPCGLKWRNPNPKGVPRFRWIVGKAFAPWRIEWMRDETETVFLTESESDCMALIQAGVEDDFYAVCVASPGTSFRREWGPLFKGKHVVLCFDGDEAGRTATQRAAEILRPHAAKISTLKGGLA